MSYDKEEFKKLWLNSSITAGEIAKKMGVTERTVYQWAKDLELPKVDRTHFRSIAKWDEDRIEEFRKDYPFTDSRVLAKKYGVNPDTIRSLASQFGVRKTDVGESNLDIEKLPTYEELMGLMKNYSRLSLMQEPPSEITVPIETDKPIALTFWADWHLGSPGVDYDLFEEDVETIANTDGLYTYVGGDQVENMMLARAVGGQIDPQLQKVLLKKVLEKVHPKIVAIGTGNHEVWTEGLAKIDYLHDIVSSMNLVYTKYGGTLHLRVGDITYTIYRRHRYRMRSSFNITHDCKQMLRLEDIPMDTAVVVLEHGHVPAKEEFIWKGQKRMALKTGSYKVLWDDFAEDKGFTNVGACNPTVIFWPDRYNMVGFLDMNDAVQVLENL